MILSEETVQVVPPFVGTIPENEKVPTTTRTTRADLPLRVQVMRAAGVVDDDLRLTIFVRQQEPNFHLVHS